MFRAKRGVKMNEGEGGRDENSRLKWVAPTGARTKEGLLRSPCCPRYCLAHNRVRKFVQVHSRGSSQFHLNPILTRRQHDHRCASKFVQHVRKVTDRATGATGSDILGKNVIPDPKSARRASIWGKARAAHAGRARGIIIP